MKNILFGLLITLSFNFILAQTDYSVVITSDSGEVVGVGKHDDSKIEMDVLAGFSGFVSISFDGATSYDAVVGEDGSFNIMIDGSLVPLSDFLANQGLGLELGRDDNLNLNPSGNGSDDSGNDSSSDDSNDDSSNDSNSDDSGNDSSDDNGSDDSGDDSSDDSNDDSGNNSSDDSEDSNDDSDDSGNDNSDDSSDDLELV